MREALASQRLRDACLPSPNGPKPRPRTPPEAQARAQGLRLIAGVDEAGRGPWAGPVVAAAVLLTTRRPLPIRIDDSKRLSPRQRLAAFQVILRHAHVGVGVVAADAVDAVNIRQATLQAMRQAVERLGVAPDVVLVDGNDPPSLPVPCWPIVEGDRLSYPIACASIVAKVSRDALMTFYHRLFPEYGFDRHKGYGTAEHLALLRTHGPSPIHRLTFEPVQLLRARCNCEKFHI